MKAEICTGHPAEAVIRVPASKSLAHRYLIAASLAQGMSVLHDLPAGEDIEATVNCLRRLGADIRADGDMTYVSGMTEVKEAELDAGASGSTLRFLLPVISVLCGSGTVRGTERLLERPLSVYEEIFAEQGIPLQKDTQSVHIAGILKPGEYTADAGISSQFLTGLMFALPLLAEDSCIRLTGEQVSRPYVNMTAEVLREAGIAVHMERDRIRIPGGQRYKALQVTCEKDWSQGAFFACLGALKGGIRLSDMPDASLQGDREILTYLRRMHADITVSGTDIYFQAHALQALTADLSDHPDLAPVLFALCTQAEGTSVFTGAARLIHKESNRLESMQEELTKLGARITISGDTVTVSGPCRLKEDITVNGHGDHRIVMALAVLAAASGIHMYIEGAEAVNKSYPAFFEDLRRTGTDVCLSE